MCFTLFFAPQVLIVHMQYFVIINRLSIPWPSSVTGLQAAMATATGSLTARALHLACLWGQQLSSAEQARVGVLTGLLQPAALVAVCCAIWATRW